MRSLPDQYSDYPGPNATEGERTAWALHFMGVIIDLPDDVEGELIDPCGQFGEVDPELYPDPTADDPPWGEEEDDDEGEDPDLFGPDPEVGPDELNGPWDTVTNGDVGHGVAQSGSVNANIHTCAYTIPSMRDGPSSRR